MAAAAVLELGQVAGLRLDGVPEVRVALVKGHRGEELARESIVKYTSSQAYAVLQSLDESIAGKFIRVQKEDERHLNLVDVQDEKEDRRLLPIAQQFHSVADARPAESHLSDLLAEAALGRFNLELKKNVTIDSFVLLDTWRDDAGFIVTDRNTFEQVTFDAKRLLKSIHPATDAKISVYTKEDLNGVCDFDNTVAGFARDAYLEVLASKATILVAKSGAVDGYIVAKGNKVLALYAETMELAHSLIKAYIEKFKLAQVTLFTKKGVWECAPDSSRPVYRRHTRSVPSSIKWAKVYALNMGVHIV